MTLDPATFVPEINHPYWPMPVGAKWTTQEIDADGEEFTDLTEVTADTKQILGITVTVVHDQLKKGSEVVEDTFDWYAQDAQGNLWYMGEDTKEFKNGQVATTEGSWEAGVDGAQPGIILPASPAVGQAYRQEYYAGHAEDNASILSVDEMVGVDAGDYTDVLLTRETTPIEPDVLEYKFYAPGVGVVEALSVSPDFSREQLTEVHGL